MRYRCHECGKWVKDKFVLGLTHFCFPEEYREELIDRYHRQGIQATPEEFEQMLRTGVTPMERRAKEGR